MLVTSILTSLLHDVSYTLSCSNLTFCWMLLAPSVISNGASTYIQSLSVLCVHFYSSTISVAVFFRLHGTTQALTTYAHSCPYEHMYANPTSMTIFEDQASKSSRLTKSPLTSRC